MLKNITFVALVTGIFYSGLILAQTTRSLSGVVSLDVAPNVRNRVIEVTVNNHSFTVIPPTFAILRPITSRQSVLVDLPAGESSVAYFVDNIIDDPSNSDPVDYTLQLRCLNCASDFPTQFYSPDGNRFGMTNSTFIDPNDLPAQLNLTAITRATIDGEIDLGRPADRDLMFSIIVTSSLNPERVLSSNNAITLRAGSSNTTYTITGLNRAIANDQYQVQLQCTNCFGRSRRRQVFADTLSPNENHSDISFTVTDVSAIVVAPMLELLLR